MLNYFAGGSLPPLQIGIPPEMSFEALNTLLRENLSQEQYEKTLVIRRYYDLQNLKAFWKGSEMDKRGSLDENQLEDALIVRDGLPEYVYEFLEKYDSKEERMGNFSELIQRYFTVELEENPGGFLHDYLQFEREWRLVFTGFRAKKLGRDLIKELQFEDPYNEVVAQLIAQKDAKTYEPPFRYGDLKGIFEEHMEDPTALNQALTEWRFNKILQMYGISVFSMDRILSYLARLILVEKWEELDKMKGMELVQKQLTKEGV